jgi:hypothetical protein
MNRSQRFALFLAALREAPAAHDRVSARELAAEILNRIEEAYSGEPFDPRNWMKHDRMYPPNDDSERKSARPGMTLFLTKGHRIWFGDNGAIRIEVRIAFDGMPAELDKPGADGAICPE